MVRDHQPSSSGVDLKEGVHCGRGGYVRAQELSQGLKQKYSFTTSSWRCSAMLTSKCTYQLEFMCTKENRCPSPIESQLCAVENQSCPPFSSEPSALPIHQIAGIAHAGIQCRPSWTKQPVRRSKPWFLQSLEKRADSVANKNVIFCSMSVIPYPPCTMS